jgi:hypothetical protein
VVAVVQAELVHPAVVEGAVQADLEQVVDLV